MKLKVGTRYERNPFGNKCWGARNFIWRIWVRGEISIRRTLIDGNFRRFAPERYPEGGYNTFVFGNNNEIIEKITINDCENDRTCRNDRKPRGLWKCIFFNRSNNEFLGIFAIDVNASRRLDKTIDQNIYPNMINLINGERLRVNHRLWRKIISLLPNGITYDINDDSYEFNEEHFPHMRRM